MASVAVKLAVVCVLVVSVGQLMMLASADDVADAALLNLQELEEEVLADELALLDDGVDKTVCSRNCKKCLVSCAKQCIRRPPIIRPPIFVACFARCAVSKDCLSKK